MEGMESGLASPTQRANEGNGIHQPGEDRSSLGLRFSLPMDSAHQWVHEPQAADLLAIKQSTLRSMRRDGRLEAGVHWIYATGKAGGPVTYNLPAIRQTLAERTIQMVELEAQRRAALRKEKQDSIETFSNDPSVRAGS